MFKTSKCVIFDIAAFLTHYMNLKTDILIKNVIERRHFRVKPRNRFFKNNFWKVKELVANTGMPIVSQNHSKIPKTSSKSFFSLDLAQIQFFSKKQFISFDFKGSKDFKDTHLSRGK